MFVSYRREAAQYLPLALHQQLTAHGIDTFYDVESIRTGQFDTILLHQIESRPYFVLLLVPGSLERCNEPSDWLRREIDHALATKRKIVPVFSSVGMSSRIGPTVLGCSGPTC